MTDTQGIPKSMTTQFAENASTLLSHPNAVFTTSMCALVALTPVTRFFSSPIQSALLPVAGAYMVKLFTEEFVHPSIGKWVPVVSLGACAIGVSLNLHGMATRPFVFPVEPETISLSLKAGSGAGLTEEGLRIGHAHQLAIGCDRSYEIAGGMSQSALLVNARAVDFYPQKMHTWVDILERHVKSLSDYQAVVFHDAHRAIAVFHVPGYVGTSSAETLTLNVSGLL